MELENLEKHIHLTKLPNGVEVMFAGQPCLTVTESCCGEYNWCINPVFAKLTYGANVFEDVPYCVSSSETIEEAVAIGIEKLDELGAFRGMIDLPQDSYVEAHKSLMEDCREIALQHTDTLLEAQYLAEGLFKSFKAEDISEANKEYDPFAAAISKVMARPAGEKPKFSSEVEPEVETPKPKRGKPTNIDLNDIRDKALENIKAGKRPTAGFERNEKIHFIRHLVNHPDFADKHVSAPGRTIGSTNVAKEAAKKSETSAFSIWSGLGK